METQDSPENWRELGSQVRAYDGAGVSNCLTEAFGTDVEITIPPPRTAVLGLSDGRDAHIKHIAEHGRMAWQAATGLGVFVIISLNFQ